MSSTKIDDFEKEIGIGQGEISKSRVWKATKIRGPEVGQEFALKTASLEKSFNEENLDRLKKLNQSIFVVNHFEIFRSTTDGFSEINFVMELCDTDIKELMGWVCENDQHDVLSQKAMAFSKQMAQATEYLLTNNIFHRDIKPSHVLVKGIGRSKQRWIKNLTDETKIIFKLAGFGKAKELTSLVTTVPDHHTFTGLSVYTAPEVKVGQKLPAPQSSTKFTVRYNALADAWSMGLVLLELCLGEVPMSAQDTKFLDNELTRVKDEDIKFIIRKLLVKNPESRFFLHEAVQLLQGLSISALGKDVVRTHYMRQEMCYEHMREPYGQALILNNEKFLPHSKLGERKGSQMDVIRLETTFKSFGFEVDSKENKTASQMTQVVSEFVRGKNMSTVVIVLMSHGFNDMICGTDDLAVSIMDDILPLLGNSNEDLRGKFKLVITNACRAREGEVPRLMQSQDCPTRLKKGKLERTDYSDTILAYSTMEKYSSIRSETEGSWYIEALCDVLDEKEWTNNYGIHTLFSEVCKTLSEKEGRLGNTPAVVQGCEYRVLGMGKEFFFPKKN